MVSRRSLKLFNIGPTQPDVAQIFLSIRYNQLYDYISEGGEELIPASLCIPIQ